MQNSLINGRYQILQQIGVGGFGLTYLAEDLHLPTRPKCVVKHLKPQITDAETLHLANRLFQQEAEILYRLGSHPQIPSLIAHFKENGEFYLVQEYIEGHTISQELNNGRRFEQKDMIRLVGQTLEILQFVHGQNVIHRDVKPANLIRRASDGSIFLIDFGAVKQVNSFPHTSPHSTFSTLTIGSHGYMPTEQMAGKPNFSSDLYALGLIAIESLTGIKPLELRQNATTNEFIWSNKAQVAAEVEHFVSKLVRYDFRQRFYSANEALQALNVIAGRAGFFRPLRANPTLPQIQPNNLAASAITLSPLANAFSARTAVAGEPLAHEAYIPPTVIVSGEHSDGGRRFQSLKPILGNVSAPAAPDDGEMSVRGKIGLFAGLALLLIVGFVVAARSVVTGYQPNIDMSRSRSETPVKTPESSTSITTVPGSDGSTLLFDEAIKQTVEADNLAKRASTQFEWNLIANKYSRAYSLLASIEPGASYYESARARMDEFKRKADLAIENANTAASGGTATPNPDPTVYPASDVSVSAPVKPVTTPKLTLSMPPKMAASNYLAISQNDGYGVTQAATTSDESMFLASLQKYSSDKNDPKHLTFEIRGGRLSGSLKLKPPTMTQKFSAGNYPAAREVSFQPSGNYGISFSQFSCSNDASHSFRINQIVYNDLYETVLVFDATFSLNCGSRKLLGRIRYDAR